jgi:hypothetical protein
VIDEFAMNPSKDASFFSRRNKQRDDMGFLKKFFTNVFHESGDTSRSATSSFEQLNENDIEAHLNIASYGKFRLTDAIRPSYDLQVKPVQAFRHDRYFDEESQTKVPVLMAAASRECLFDLFIELIQPLGETVDVVLETSHHRNSSQHQDLYREHIDMPVLTSILYEYEDLLLNDGCTGIAVLNPGLPQEVQFDEHKLLVVYGTPLTQYERVLKSNSVPLQPDVRFITEGEHVHSTTDRYFERFQQLKTELGMDVGYDLV